MYALIFSTLIKSFKHNCTYILIVVCIYAYTIDYCCEYIYKNKIYLAEPLWWRIVFFLNDSYISILLVAIIWFYKNAYIRRCGLVFLCFYCMIIKLNKQSLYLYILTSQSYNTILINGLLNIHPILLYIGVIYLMKIMNINKVTFLSKLDLRSVRHIISITRESINQLVLYSSLSLGLGCWWAQQELNWGGWWNWDAIEFIALILFLISVVYSHTLKYKNTIIIAQTSSLILVFLLLCYFLSRHDIINSIHSFVANTTNNNIRHTIISILILSLFFVFACFIKIIKFKNLYENHSKLAVALLCISYTYINLYAVYNNIYPQNILSDFFVLKFVYLSLITFYIVCVIKSCNYKVTIYFISFIISLYLAIYEFSVVCALFLVVFLFYKKHKNTNNNLLLISHTLLFLSITFLILSNTTDFIWYAKIKTVFNNSYISTFLFSNTHSVVVSYLTEYTDYFYSRTFFNNHYFELLKFNINVERYAQYIETYKNHNINKIQFKKTLNTYQLFLIVIYIYFTISCLLIYIGMYKAQSGIV